MYKISLDKKEDIMKVYKVFHSMDFYRLVCLTLNLTYWIVFGNQNNVQIDQNTKEYLYLKLLSQIELVNSKIPDIKLLSKVFIPLEIIFMRIETDNYLSRKFVLLFDDKNQKTKDKIMQIVNDIITSIFDKHGYMNSFETICGSKDEFNKKVSKNLLPRFKRKIYGTSNMIEQLFSNDKCNVTKGTIEDIKERKEFILGPKVEFFNSYLQKINDKLKEFSISKKDLNEGRLDNSFRMSKRRKQSARAIESFNTVNRTNQLQLTYKNTSGNDTPKTQQNFNYSEFDDMKPENDRIKNNNNYEYKYDNVAFRNIDESTYRNNAKAKIFYSNSPHDESNNYRENKYSQNNSDRNKYSDRERDPNNRNINMNYNNNENADRKYVTPSKLNNNDNTNNRNNTNNFPDNLNDQNYGRYNQNNNRNNYNNDPNKNDNSQNYRNRNSNNNNPNYNQRNNSYNQNPNEDNNMGRNSYNNKYRNNTIRNKMNESEEKYKLLSPQIYNVNKVCNRNKNNILNLMENAPKFLFKELNPELFINFTKKYNKVATAYHIFCLYTLFNQNYEYYIIRKIFNKWKKKIRRRFKCSNISKANFYNCDNFGHCRGCICYKKGNKQAMMGNILFKYIFMKEYNPTKYYLNLWYKNTFF